MQRLQKRCLLMTVNVIMRIFKCYLVPCLLLIAVTLLIWCGIRRSCTKETITHNVHQPVYSECGSDSVSLEIGGVIDSVGVFNGAIIRLRVVNLFSGANYSHDAVLGYVASAANDTVTFLNEIDSGWRNVVYVNEGKRRTLGASSCIPKELFKGAQIDSVILYVYPNELLQPLVVYLGAGEVHVVRGRIRPKLSKVLIYKRELNENVIR